MRLIVFPSARGPVSMFRMKEVDGIVSVLVPASPPSSWSGGQASSTGGGSGEAWRRQRHLGAWPLVPCLLPGEPHVKDGTGRR